LKLAPETIAVYVQAATKVFGSWCADLAEHWDDDDLPKVKGAVDSMIEQVSEFASNPNIEVQERVRLPRRFALSIILISLG
jgi:AP-3 complex subunit delta